MQCRAVTEQRSNQKSETSCDRRTCWAQVIKRCANCDYSGQTPFFTVGYLARHDHTACCPGPVVNAQIQHPENVMLP